MATPRTLSRDDDRRPFGTGERIAQLFVLLECDRPLAGSSRHLLVDVDRVEIGRADRRSASRSRGALTLNVPDTRMSAPHARITRRDGKWIIEDAGSKNGVIIDGEARGRATLQDGMVLELGHTLLLYREATGLSPNERVDRDSAEFPATALGVQTFVPSLVRAIDDLGEVVRSQKTAILVQGETGTGKELLARAIHTLSKRPGDFIAVNCGALPDNLVESELYGYRRGAFSGAERNHAGFVRSADRGTLFLDEVGDLRLASQAALLRVLQEREVTPLGEARPVPIDIQLVAATHHPLPVMVEQGKFRQDLYARLASFTIEIPPLRERREDFGLLLAAMLPRVTDRADLRISCAAAVALVEHDWPSNIRELESVLKVAVALSRGGPIRHEHLPPALTADDSVPASALSPDDVLRRDELVGLLRAHTGNISAVARAMGKARGQIHRWLKRYQIDLVDFR